MTGCASRVLTYEQLTHRIETDPGPDIQYRGSDKSYHYLFYSPCSGPVHPIMILNPALRIRCNAREVRLAQGEVVATESFPYSAGNEGRSYYLLRLDERERFFQDFERRGDEETQAQQGGAGQSSAR